MNIRMAGVMGKGKTSSCCFIMPLRLIPTYMVVRNSPIPQNVAEDLESDCKDAQKLQWALDVHVVADNMVKGVKQEKESQWQKSEKGVAKKAEEEEVTKVEVEWIAMREESWRMNDKLPHICMESLV